LLRLLWRSRCFRWAPHFLERVRELTFALVDRVERQEQRQKREQQKREQHPFDLEQMVEWRKELAVEWIEVEWIEMWEHEVALETWADQTSSL
jgi:hypothetical protein